MDPATITIASLRGAVMLVTIGKSVASGIKTLSSFPQDLHGLIVDLEWLQLRLQEVLQRPILVTKIGQSSEFQCVFDRFLLKLNTNFQVCDELLKKYKAEDFLIHPASRDRAEPDTRQNSSVISVTASGQAMETTPSTAATQPDSAVPDISKQKPKRKAMSRLRFWRGKPKSHALPAEQEGIADTQSTDTARSNLGDDAIEPLLGGGINEGVAVLEAEQKLIAERNKLRRVKWLSADKAAFEKNVREIREAVCGLDNYAANYGPVPKAESADADASLPGSEGEWMAAALLSIHKALTSANRKGEQELFLVIKILEDQSESRADLQNNLADMEHDSKPKSTLFKMRRHFESALIDNACFLIIDHSLIRADNAQDIIERIDTASDHDFPELDPIERWGVLRAGKGSIIVYHMPKDLQASSRSLADILIDDDYKSTCFPCLLLG